MKIDLDANTVLIREDEAVSKCNNENIKPNIKSKKTFLLKKIKFYRTNRFIIIIILIIAAILLGVYFEYLLFKNFKPKQQTVKKPENKNQSYSIIELKNTSLDISSGQLDDMKECPQAEYAHGFQLTVDYYKPQHYDNTGLNKIMLICKDSGKTIESPSSEDQIIYGQTGHAAYCSNPMAYFVGFSLRVQYFQEDIDNTLVNNIAMLCNDRTVVKGYGNNIGVWSEWIRCPNSEMAIVGIQTISDNTKTVSDNYDQVGIVNVKFMCREIVDDENNKRFDIIENLILINVGLWDTQMHECSDSTYAMGVRVLMQDSQIVRTRDRTSLNQICLICSNSEEIMSPPLQTGLALVKSNYSKELYCKYGSYLNSFRLRQTVVSTDKSHNTDNTGANDIELMCSDMKIVHDTKLGETRGEWQNWRSCPTGMRIVGLQAQSDSSIGMSSGYDRVGLVNVRFKCKHLQVTNTGCPWKIEDKRCLLVNRVLLNNQQATDYCQAFNASLFMIRNSLDYQYLFSHFLLDQTNTIPIHLGLFVDGSYGLRFGLVFSQFVSLHQQSAKACADNTWLGRQSCVIAEPRFDAPPKLHDFDGNRLIRTKQLCLMNVVCESLAWSICQISKF